MPHEEVGKFLATILQKNDAEWWFGIYLTGLGDEVFRELDFESVLRNSGFLAAGVELNRQQYLRDFNQGWGSLMRGGTRGGMSGIFHSIENVDTL